MEVDTNELLHRIGAVLRGISDKMDRLIEIGERVEGEVRLPSEEESQTFANAKEPAKKPEPEHPAGPQLSMECYRLVNDSDIGKIVEVQNSTADPWRECTLLAIDWDRPYGFLCRHSDPVAELRWCFARIKNDEPAKEPEHPAGPKPDPGKGYRLLSKEPPEDLQLGDEYRCRREKQWIESNRVREGYRNQLSGLWYRRKIEQPEPAWEPKVGDWVKVTRPEDWIEWRHPRWEGAMNQFDKKIGKIECEWGDCFQICGFAAPNGFRYQFHRDWLSPPEPPEPVYREPVLPADCGKVCQFSDDGQSWLSGWVYGWMPGRNWVTLNNNSWKHARIKNEP